MAEQAFMNHEQALHLEWAADILRRCEHFNEHGWSKPTAARDSVALFEEVDRWNERDKELRAKANQPAATETGPVCERCDSDKHSTEFHDAAPQGAPCRACGRPESDTVHRPADDPNQVETAGHHAFRAETQGAPTCNPRCIKAPGHDGHCVVDVWD